MMSQWTGTSALQTTGPTLEIALNDGSVGAVGKSAELAYGRAEQRHHRRPNTGRHVQHAAVSSNRGLGPFQDGTCALEAQ